MTYMNPMMRLKRQCGIDRRILKKNQRVFAITFGYIVGGRIVEEEDEFYVKIRFDGGSTESTLKDNVFLSIEEAEDYIDFIDGDNC